jgi:hypothetical protein
VTGPDGKIVERARRNSLKAALETALVEEGEPQGRRANLQRARASVAR